MESRACTFCPKGVDSLTASQVPLHLIAWHADMEFVKNLTPPDFQAKNFTLSFSPNFNSFSKGGVPIIKMEI